MACIVLGGGVVAGGGWGPWGGGGHGPRRECRRGAVGARAGCKRSRTGRGVGFGVARGRTGQQSRSSRLLRQRSGAWGGAEGARRLTVWLARGQPFVWVFYRHGGNAQPAPHPARIPAAAADVSCADRRAHDSIRT